MKMYKLNMERKRAFCGNCGKTGHLFKECLEPVISIGVIAYKRTLDGIKYLSVMRRHSYAFVEIVRAKYNPTDEYIKTMVENLTPDEQIMLVTEDFDTIWKHLWTVHESGPFVRDFHASKDRYLEIISRVKKAIGKYEPKYIEPEWGFPKGRRNLNEDDFHCGIREFMEETGLTKKQFRIISSIPRIEESYTANNNVNYKHIYYIAELLDDNLIKVDTMNKEQVGEIGDIRLLTAQELISKLREDDKAKEKMILELEEKLNKRNNK